MIYEGLVGSGQWQGTKAGLGGLKGARERASRLWS
jgi:hypothetical protein